MATPSQLVGQMVSHYRIIEKLGAGGMGEVYRARDQRLHRDVAIKVLSSSVSYDPDRLRRFEQEATAAAALNHPNILAIFEMGTHEGAPYLVSELLEGEVLREYIKGSPISGRKITDFGVQIARGLAAAHQKGIVHRDLKPENLFVTKDERIKILDFGLAKLRRPDRHPEHSTPPTLSIQTEPGVVMGTVGYMSPEQVRGEAADHRTDIFSLGVILYEMASGRKAFKGGSSVETMSAILKEDLPELCAMNPQVSPALDRIIRRCLEKAPERRFQSATDLAFAIESSSADSSSRTVSSARGSSHLLRWIMLTSGALALIIGVGLGIFFSRHNNSLPNFQQLTFNRGILYSAKFAADGQDVIYSAGWNGQQPQVYSTHPDSPESRSLDLTNTQLFAVSRSSELAISSDCKYLFAAECGGTLARVPLSGGAPREIVDNVNSADWSSDGADLAVTRQVGGKFRVEFPVGRVLYETPGGWLRSVRVSPRGDYIAFLESPVRGGDAGYAVVLDKSGHQKVRSEFFLSSVQGLAWSPKGNEVWFGATRDQDEANEVHALSLSGKHRVLMRVPGILRLHDVSPDGRLLISRETWRGTLLVRSLGETAERDLSWLDYSYASDLSPDGGNLAFFEWGEAARTSAIAYTRKLDGTPPVKLGDGAFPAFSPDRKWVVAITPPGVADRIFLLPTGPGESKTLPAYNLKRYAAPGWMPDGQQIIFVGNDERSWRIYAQDLAGGRPRPLTPEILAEPERFEAHLVSPDGRYVFARDLDGKPWLYPLNGGDRVGAAGIDRDDVWIGWSANTRSAYVFHWGEIPVTVFRVDLSTGKKEPIAQLAPRDPTGLSVILTQRVTPDGKSYAYSYERIFSELYLVSGVK